MKDPVACVNCAPLLFQFRLAFALLVVSEKTGDLRAPNSQTENRYFTNRNDGL
jgi:hypothetical protein